MSRFISLFAVTMLGASPALAQTTEPASQVGGATAPAAQAPPAPPPEPEADTHRMRWQPGWRRFGWPDVAQTVVTAGVYFYVDFGLETPMEPNWTGPILFDKAARDALVAKSRDGRNRAAVISDVTWYAPMAIPFVESVAVPLFFDDWNWDIAWQLTAMNLQAASVNALFTRFGHRVIARERPDTQPCIEDNDYDGTCFGGVNASFPSGHTSSATMGAALACIHHSNLPFYGGGFPDAAVCGGATAMALTSGVARIVADRHYATDVIAGAMIGTLSGFVMPLALHYHGVGSFSGSSSRSSAHLRWMVMPMASDDTFGAGMYGWF